MLNMKPRALIIAAATALALAGSTAIAGPAAAAGQSARIAVPDVDILTNSCSDKPVSVSIDPSTPSTHYAVNVYDPLGHLVSGQQATNYGITFPACGSDLAGIYTVKVTYDSIEYGSGSAQKTFVVTKPVLEVVQAQGGIPVARHKHSAKKRKVVGQLAIHGQPLTGRLVTVTKNGRPLQRITDGAGRATVKCQRGKKCLVQFSYDGFVSSQVIKVRKGKHHGHHHGHH